MLPIQVIIISSLTHGSQTWYVISFGRCQTSLLWHTGMFEDELGYFSIWWAGITAKCLRSCHQLWDDSFLPISCQKLKVNPSTRETGFSTFIAQFRVARNVFLFQILCKWKGFQRYASEAMPVIVSLYGLEPAALTVWSVSDNWIGEFATGVFPTFRRPWTFCCPSKKSN